MMSDIEFNQFIGQEVVLDVQGMFVYTGTLSGRDEKYYLLENADVHDLRDSSTTRERYVIECKIHGVRANRKKVLVQISEVISLSLLCDVVE